MTLVEYVMTSILLLPDPLRKYWATRDTADVTTWKLLTPTSLDESTRNMTSRVRLHTANKTKLKKKR